MRSIYSLFAKIFLCVLIGSLSFIITVDHASADSFRSDTKKKNPTVRWTTKGIKYRVVLGWNHPTVKKTIEVTQKPTVNPLGHIVVLSKTDCFGCNLYFSWYDPSQDKWILLDKENSGYKIVIRLEAKAPSKKSVEPVTNGQYPNLAIIHVKSDIFNPGTRDIQPTTVGKLFYKRFPDHYDFLVVYPLFLHGMGSDYYVQAQNHVKGIGLPEKDISSWFGSQGRLLGMAIANPGTKPSLVLHEIGHHWCSYSKFREENGTVSESLYKLWQYAPFHWTPLINEDYGIIGGGRWTNNGDGTFTRASAPTRRKYLPISLYMMGLIPANEVKPISVIELDQAPGWWQPGSKIKGHEKTITIEQIIRAEGERIPGVESAKKAFKAAFVVLVLEGEEPKNLGSILSALELVRQKVPGEFSYATGNRASLKTTL